MSPSETRKKQILKFRKLSPLDRLSWSLEAGKEMFSMPPPKKVIYLKLKNAEKIKRKKNLERLLDVSPVLISFFLKNRRDACTTLF